MLVENLRPTVTAVSVLRIVQIRVVILGFKVTGLRFRNLARVTIIWVQVGQGVVLWTLRVCTLGFWVTEPWNMTLNKGIEGTNLTSLIQVNDWVSFSNVNSLAATRRIDNLRPKVASMFGPEAVGSGPR